MRTVNNSNYTQIHPQGASVGERTPSLTLGDCQRARASECSRQHSLAARCLAACAPFRCCPVASFQNREVSHAIVNNDLAALRRALALRTANNSKCMSSCHPGVNGGIDGTSGNALHLAIAGGGSAEVVHELVQSGANINQSDRSGALPLHLAAVRCFVVC